MPATLLPDFISHFNSIGKLAKLLKQKYLILMAKSYPALQTVRHRFNIYASSCVASAL